MVQLASLRDDEHHTDEDTGGVSDMSNAGWDGDRPACEGADEFPRLSSAEKMEVMESMGLTPKGSCDIHTKRYGLFGRGVEACEDFRWAMRYRKPYPVKPIPPMVCGSCWYWHFEGICE